MTFNIVDPLVNVSRGVVIFSFSLVRISQFEHWVVLISCLSSDVIAISDLELIAISSLILIGLLGLMLIAVSDLGLIATLDFSFNFLFSFLRTETSLAIL